MIDINQAQLYPLTWKMDQDKQSRQEVQQILGLVSHGDPWSLAGLYLIQQQWERTQIPAAQLNFSRIVSLYCAYLDL